MNTVFTKVYSGESLSDFHRDLSDAIDATYNPVVAAIPQDEDGFTVGFFKVTIEWCEERPCKFQSDVLEELQDKLIVAEAALQDKEERDLDLFWQLLRSLEERVGNSAGALDAELIRQSYRHFNNVMGTKLVPTYVSPATR